MKEIYCFLFSGGDGKGTRQIGRLGDYAEVFFLVLGQNITQDCIEFALGEVISNPMKDVMEAEV